MGPRTSAFLSSTLNRLVLFYGLTLLVTFVVIGGLSMIAYDELVERDVHRTVMAERVGLIEIHRTEGDQGLIRTIDALVDEDARREAVYLLTDPHGEVRAGHLSDVPTEALHRNGWVRFPWNDRGDEVVAYVETLSDGWRLVTGHSTGERQHLRTLIVRFGLGIMSLLAALTLLLGWMLHRALSNNLQASLDAVDRFAAGHFDERIRSVAGDDPLARLTRTLNRMLDRIVELIGGIQSTTDAIAHDLRTPLMRLSARLEQTRARMPDGDAAQSIDDALNEAASLINTFNGLMRLSRIEAPGDAPSDIVALDRIVDDAVDLWRAVAESKGGRIDAELAPLSIAGDGDLLFQMITNLLDNAVKYGPERGRIDVVLREDHGHALLSVRDRGPGIPAEDRDRVFDRFVRLEEHRGSPGSGLGLSLVRAIALRHRAELRLDDGRPGLIVELRFPLATQVNIP